MLTRKTLTEDQARYAMQHGEFPDSVIREGEHVAIVLTQGWCPQWVSMNVWLDSMVKKGEPESFDLTLYEFIYDQVDFFDQFLQFKERRFQNEEIPYIRYYAAGECFHTSNYVPSRQFLRHFESAAESQRQ